MNISESQHYNSYNLNVLHDTLVSCLQNRDTKTKRVKYVKEHRGKSVKVMFHVINVGNFMLSLYVDRSFQKLDFSIGTTNTTVVSNQ